MKHGIGAEDAIQAATWATWVENLDDDSPARQLRLGFDTPGRMLETVVLVVGRPGIAAPDVENAAVRVQAPVLELRCPCCPTVPRSDA
ncbi:hypothetical protein Rrhod_2975 [Rhodococcus rhodnii LMG 5362]|uniref:Uncharacterized protein n=1 Tax=Rhodococcus rhodnii LMG 5362 TaxID=1273125 RepID=R7WK68_9NOCA|nr:hypothetical protein Rrhod_2975 [Rhodococcus rhodnii LMG 5362]